LPVGSGFSTVLSGVFIAEEGYNHKGWSRGTLGGCFEHIPEICVFQSWRLFC